MLEHGNLGACGEPGLDKASSNRPGATCMRFREMGTASSPLRLNSGSAGNSRKTPQTSLIINCHIPAVCRTTPCLNFKLSVKVTSEVAIRAALMHKHLTGAQYLWTTRSNTNGLSDRARVWCHGRSEAECIRATVFAFMVCTLMAAMW